ncbi:hypothetical protein FXF61_09530 [Pseudomonas sp. C27(2019)]|uniref:hypothetical protein n=1 Tax=Pseudomonas sp. C27(2019) TaxID=2604941 RepID=UPI001248E923|nr:hypothetical protein [Pseudomonas sp. C27(2019)]QEY59382.1 hypothetical protein FXF61_09530 [Pseudomonas sp. C27(2019)]
MNTVKSEELVKTSFSDFIRDASAQEKERIFSKIVARATLEQQEMLAKAKQMSQQPTNVR